MFARLKRCGRSRATWRGPKRADGWWEEVEGTSRSGDGWFRVSREARTEAGRMSMITMAAGVHSEAGSGTYSGASDFDCVEHPHKGSTGLMSEVAGPGCRD